MAMSTATGPGVHSPLYYWQENVEDLERYREGGYHPIQIGDQFSSNRYRIVHKLGYGSYSTVWLARDAHQDRYVSIKVVSADASSGSASEVEIRGYLRQEIERSRHPGSECILSPLDEFKIDGPNGRHQCLVSELVGPTVLDARDAQEHEILPIKTAKRVFSQLAMGIAFLHQCGILHGDIHSRNIAFLLPDLDSWPVEKIYSEISDPEKQEVFRLDGKQLGPEVPPYTVEPAYFWRLGMESITKNMKIIDYGEASFINERRQKLHTPLPFRAPESFFGEEIGMPADIWSFGCTTFDISGKESMFTTCMLSQDSILAELVGALGPLPHRWWKEWKNKSAFFTDDGSPMKEIGFDIEVSKDRGPRLLTQKLQEKRRGRINELRSRSPSERLTLDEMKGLEEIFAMVFKYEPSERATAEQIIRSSWLQS
ncbi:MAG: hypothetical protein Q9163_001663 [Psora crenata]